MEDWGVVRADDAVCQRCNERGGRVVVFKRGSMLESRWVCPHCIEAAEAEVERIACAATGLKQCCEEQRAEVERLRQLAARRMEDVEQARANLRALVEAGDRLVGLHLSYGIPCYEWDEAKRKAGL
jgi:hypothetical protein